MDAERGNEIESDASPADSAAPLTLPTWKRATLNVLLLVFVGTIVAFLGGAPKIGILLFVTFAGSAIGFVYSLSESEMRWFEAKVQDMADDFEEGYREAKAELDESAEPAADTTAVCRECRQEVSRDVNRCPHCGWKPKKRGGLWWGTTAVMSLNPIGWAMAAKGAKDNHEAKKGVWEETAAPPESDSPPDHQPEATDPLTKLERLNELKEAGAIEEAEFEEKKQELLEEL